MHYSNNKEKKLKYKVLLANPQALGHPLVCLLVLGKLPNSCIFPGNFLI